MKKAIGGLAALILGLLFCCIKVEANDDILPDAGFTEFLEDVECVPIYPPEPRYYISDEDMDLLLRVGVLEAGEVDVEGIAQVMQVVLNRLESDKFPNTISEVIFQRKQFCTAKRLAKANITDSAREALEAVKKGDYTANEALYFESLPGKAWEKCHKYLFSYGGHDFYK